MGCGGVACAAGSAAAGGSAGTASWVGAGVGAAAGAEYSPRKADCEPLRGMPAAAVLCWRTTASQSNAETTHESLSGTLI